MAEARTRTRGSVQRSAKPFETPPRVRTRGDGHKPVAVSGLVTGIVEVDAQREGQAREHIVENVKAHRRMPEGVTQVAHVMVRSGVTLSPQQYESIRIDVSLSLPTAPEPEAYEAAYGEAADWVGRKMSELAQAWRG